MLSTKPAVEPPAQQTEHKRAVLEQLRQGNVVELVFTKTAPCQELAGLQVLESRGVLLLTEGRRAAVSLALQNKYWPEAVDARSFRVTVIELDTALFWQQIDVRYLEEVTKIT
jgi:hypothetical protein